jgi:hypothetical protein
MTSSAAWRSCAVHNNMVSSQVAARLSLEFSLECVAKITAVPFDRSAPSLPKTFPTTARNVRASSAFVTSSKIAFVFWAYKARAIAYNN